MVTLNPQGTEREEGGEEAEATEAGTTVRDGGGSAGQEKLTGGIIEEK